jgi:hypothetical protein
MAPTDLLRNVTLKMSPLPGSGWEVLSDAYLIEAAILEKRAVDPHNMGMVDLRHRPGLHVSYMQYKRKRK